MWDNLDHITERELEELKTAFYAQAYEIVERLQDSLLQIEEHYNDKDLLTAIKRHVHTLKGDSLSVGLTSVGGVCHGIEDLLANIFSNACLLDKSAVELLFSCVDAIHQFLVESETGNYTGSADTITERIRAYLREENSVSACTGHGQKDKSVLQAFTEYQRLQIQKARQEGQGLFDVEIVFHELCRERGLAARMIIQRLSGAGEIVAVSPEADSEEIETAKKIMFVLTSREKEEQLRQTAFIAGITGAVQIRDLECSADTGTPEKPDASDPAMHISKLENELMRVEPAKVDRIMNLVGELIIGRSMIEQIARDLEGDAVSSGMAARLFMANAYLERIVADLQKSAMKMRMVPINQIFRRFPKMVRDLSSHRGKKITVTIHGRETDLDKKIVDALGEPLSHIIRNAVDHGIETPEERRRMGKPEEGVITIRAYHEASQIVIEVSDDGRGIDVETLKRKAAESGFIDIAESDKISDDTALNLIFCSGLSTSSSVNETSGRGVGMDAVKASVQALKGVTYVESKQGEGTTFRMRLPLTLAVIKALLFEVSSRQYAIPISSVTEAVRVSRESLTTIDGRDALLLRERVIPVISLRDLFETAETADHKQIVIVVNAGGRNIGLRVDRLVGQQELVIKSVEESFTQSDLVAGASILGDGRAILILDAAAVYRRAIEREKKKEAVT